MSKHHAPSVAYPLGRSRLQGQLLLGFCMLGLAVISFWTLAADTFNWRQGLGWGVLALAGATALLGSRNAIVGQLAWDGQAWHWHSRGYQAGAAEHAVSVACDCQAWMLLRIDNPAHARLWFWAERRALPERWLDLRRAVYSPHRGLNGVANTALDAA